MFVTVLTKVGRSLLHDEPRQLSEIQTQKLNTCINVYVGEEAKYRECKTVSTWKICVKGMHNCCNIFITLELYQKSQNVNTYMCIDMKTENQLVIKQMQGIFSEDSLNDLAAKILK